MPQHVLLTVLGLVARETCYVLNSKESRKRLAPLALFELLRDTDKPDLVLALCTQKAEENTLPILREDLHDQIEVKCVRVPNGTTQEDVNTFMSKVAQAIVSTRCQTLSVDVTHGFRHFSFLTYLIALYVSTLNRLEVRGAYYGAQQGDTPSHFLDLAPLLELPDWIHGIRVLGETGSAAAIASILSRKHRDDASLDIARNLKYISEAYLSGLPLEAGYYIRRLLQEQIRPLRKQLRVKQNLPLTDELVNELRLILDPLRLPDGSTSPGWKRNLRITKAELARQATFVNRLLEQENTAAAVGMMREWVVSWVLLQMHGADVNWLNYGKHRKRAEWTLNSLRRAYDRRNQVEVSLSDSQKRLADFWGCLTTVRNGFHHHGMRPEQVIGGKHVDHWLQRITEYWRWLLNCPGVDLGFSQGTTLLISPIGRRPGVLFSAVRNCCQHDVYQPDCCMVICSSDTENSIQEALNEARYSGSVVHVRMEDPHGGYEEMPKLISDSLRYLASADSVFVNLTGGTTLMGLLAQRIAEEARGLCRSVSRFGLIDKRPPHEQDANPYVMAESFWLDRTEDAADEDDN